MLVIVMFFVVLVFFPIAVLMLAEAGAIFLWWAEVFCSSSHQLCWGAY